MNYKYLGEAVALLGIAYSIMRWVTRNAPDADASPRAVMKVEPGRFGLTRETSVPRPSDAPLPPDPHLLDAAAAAFGVTPEALAGMDVRERVLLVSGYVASRGGPTERDAAGPE